MKKHFSKIKWSLFLVGFLSMHSLSATNWFVKENGTGTGSSWSDALSPDEFVAKLSNGIQDDDVVYLAAGNYYPGTERTAFFNITKGITLIGGFSPDISGDITEITYPSLYKTVFNGDIDKNGKLDNSNSDKIIEINTTKKVVLKGITITGGYRVNQGNNQNGQPAGINVKEGSDLELHFCTIKKNKSEASGGGMYILGAKVYCYRTVISENEAHNRGAGIRIQNGLVSSTLILESCLLKNNNLISEWGGAIQVSGNNNPLYCINTTIINNTAGRGGAAINSAAPVYIVSSTIANNTCSNTDNGQDVRCESVNQMHIINSIITGYPDKTPHLFLNGSDKKITSDGYNVIGSIGGTGTFLPATTDVIEKNWAEVFGSNGLSKNGGYPQTLALTGDFSLPDLTILETFGTSYSIPAILTKDQRGFDRPSVTSTGAYEKSVKVKYTRIETLLKQLKDPYSPYVFVVAHRGDWRNAPENSIAAIEKAAEMGVDMVEIDIQKTKDGDFVLMHDGNINRMTNSSGNVSDYTVAELKQFRLLYSDGKVSDQYIPTLKEALLACKGKVLVNIDKGGDVLAQIIPIIRETETEDHVVLKGGSSVTAVKNMLGSNRQLVYMPVVDLESSSATDFIDSFINDFNPHAYEVSFKGLSFSPLNFTQHIVNSGSRVWINSLWESLCGGHEDEKAMSDPDGNWGWILDQKATIIQTDRPKELIEYLQSKGLRGSRGISIPKAPQGYVPVLDGTGNDPIWSKIKPIQLTNYISGTLSEAPSAEDHSASFKAFWTDEGIYFHGKRTDDVIAERGSNSSESKYDLFRFFFNPTGVKDTDIDNIFSRPDDKSAGDVYPQSRSTMAYVIIGDDEKVQNGMMKRWEVFGNGSNYSTWPELTGDKGQKVVHHLTADGYEFDFFVPFSTIIPEETALGAINGIPSKIGFNIESYDGDVTGSSPPNTKSMLSWNENSAKSDARYDINTFGEMFLSEKELSLTMNPAPIFTNISEENNIHRISNGAGIWGDYNNDGFLDLFCIGNNINNSWTETAHLYKNDGNGGFSEVNTSITGIRESTCAWIDFDNDGNIDLIIAGANGGNKSNAYTRLYKNTGESGGYTFTEITDTGFENIYNETEKCYRYLSVGDYDNDGFADILITGQNRSGTRRTDLYKNNAGTGKFIKQESVYNNGTLRPLSSGCIAFGDMDNDGRLDILSSGYGDPFGSDPTETGTFRVYQNAGDGTFNKVEFGAEDWGTFLGQCSWADVNHDGFQDFIITGKHRHNGNQDINQAKIYLNNGNGSFTQIRSVEANLEPLNTSGMDWADVNNDGFVDLIMNGNGNTSNGKTWVYINDGTGLFHPYITAIKPARASTVAIADYNNDGYPDVFITGYRDGDGGGSVGEIWRNDGKQNMPRNMAPSVPQGLSAIYENGKAIFSWNASFDDLTPSASLKYNVYIKEKSGNSISMTLPADISSGFLKVGDISTGLTTTSYSITLPEGSYDWGVQAIDNGKLGSAFASSTLQAKGNSIESNQSHDIRIYSRNGSVCLEFTDQIIEIVVVDLTGKELYSEVRSSDGCLNRIFETGVYVVRVKSSKGTIVKKIVL